MEGIDVKIGEVVTEVEVTEGIGSLSPEDVKRLVALVLEKVRIEQARHAQQQRDTTVHDRAFRGDLRG
jgi:hypothetical protein